MSSKLVIWNRFGQPCGITGTGYRVDAERVVLSEFFCAIRLKFSAPINILDKVWSNYSEASAGYGAVHITKLRSKIDIEGQESLIKTLHRVGYKFEKPTSMGEVKLLRKTKRPGR